MNILIDDIKQFKEFTIRGCKEVILTYKLILIILIILTQLLNSVRFQTAVIDSRPYIAMLFKYTRQQHLKTYPISKVTMEK